MLALVRGTLAILNYTTLGLTPALVHLMAKAATPVRAIPVRDDDSSILTYADPSVQAGYDTVGPLQRIYYSGRITATILAVVGCIVVLVLADNFAYWLNVTPGLRNEIGSLVWWIGLGMVLRLWSDASGAVLQTNHRIAIDNLLLVVSDVLWVALTTLVLTNDADGLPRVGMSFAAAGGVLAGLRLVAAESIARTFSRRIQVDWRAVRTILSMGLFVAAAQVADYLYAPIDMILINKLIDAETVADYAPAIQVDAGLLLLVGALAAVLLPKTALAHARQDRALIRRYYIRGTLASAVLLLLAAGVVWALAPWLFKLWLGEYRDGTRLILPLVLTSTVIGGSSAVGRSVLLGIGHVKAFTVSVLLAGIANVILSYALVRYFDLGLLGIVLGTVVVVVLRCAIWMPWYVMRRVRD